MVILNKIYTKTGDNGTTALGSGERRKKSDARIKAYGSVDETNSAIGVARSNLEAASSPLDVMLENIQNDLFDLGADLAVPFDQADQPALRIVAEQVLRLERDIDLLNGDLEPLRSFVLPGGSAAAAFLHLARTIARRAEREMVELATNEDEQVAQHALHYINRVSDFLFVAARHANDYGKSDTLWTPGKNR